MALKRKWNNKVTAAISQRISKNTNFAELLKETNKAISFKLRESGVGKNTLLFTHRTNLRYQSDDCSRKSTQIVLQNARDKLAKGINPTGIFHTTHFVGRMIFREALDRFFSKTGLIFPKKTLIADCVTGVPKDRVFCGKSKEMNEKLEVDNYFKRHFVNFNSKITLYFKLKLRRFLPIASYFLMIGKVILWVMRFCSMSNQKRFAMHI